MPQIGWPKGMRRVTVPVQIHKELIEQFDILAAKSKENRTKYINMVLHQYIEEPQLRRPLIYKASILKPQFHISRIV